MLQWLSLETGGGTVMFAVVQVDAAKRWSWDILGCPIFPLWLRFACFLGNNDVLVMPMGWKTVLLLVFGSCGVTWIFTGLLHLVCLRKDWVERNKVMSDIFTVISPWLSWLWIQLAEDEAGLAEPLPLSGILRFKRRWIVAVALKNNEHSVI